MGVAGAVRWLKEFISIQSPLGLQVRLLINRLGLIVHATFTGLGFTGYDGVTTGSLRGYYHPGLEAGRRT